MKELVPKHPRTAEFVAQGLYAVNSFKELEAKISALESKDERGAAFEVFAEAFLVTQEGIDPNHYWPQGKIPLLVQENLGLPRNDFGIDSVYLNQTQQYDACQCKFRTGRPTLGWEELATFVALASSDKFQNKVLFTNCEDVVPILRDRVVLIRDFTAGSAYS
jgi:predicted helicase